MASRPEAAEAHPQLRITRRYPVPPAQVWRAWTDPQALSRWFGPGEVDSVTVAELDVREGGAWWVRFRTPDGEEHGVSGVYQTVIVGRRLSFTWAWQSTPDRVSLVHIDLDPVEGGTQLSFLQERFFDRAARDNHARGWAGTFAKLDAMLEGMAPMT
jgi:uncharacterized protein YndB with AHSA1/START domain